MLHKNGVPSWFGYHKLEFSANVVMFIPIGFLVTMLLAQRLWWFALLICPALSIAIEVTQGLFFERTICLRQRCALQLPRGVDRGAGGCRAQCSRLQA